ncbi:MAG: ribonuclease III [Micrococcaceae bacterium]
MTQKLLKRLGVDIDPETLSLALTHRSYSYEHGGIPHNERLEFLGDSVLGLSVTDRLYRSFPDLAEGELAKRRSAVVSTQALAQIAKGIDLGENIKLGKGEEMTDGRQKASILADTMEAVIGAAYLSCGPEKAKELVLRLTQPLIENTEHLMASLDWKTSIQEFASSQQLGEVDYHIKSTGPDHAKAYEAEIFIAGKKIATGSGSSKKEAEKNAAQDAWKLLNKDTETQN